MSGQDPVAWLRAQVETRLALAREAAAQTEESWWFDYQGRPVARIVGAPWESSYTDGTWNCDDPLDDCHELRRAGTVSGELIAANDPQDTIARCEAELAILDLHQAVTSNGGWLDGPEWQECETCGPNNDGSGVYAVPGRGEAFWPCRTVRLLASGYRHSPGYEEAGWPKP